MILFSMPVGITDSNTAELLALWKAFHIMAASRWVDTHGALFESDSYNVASWIQNPHEVPWKHRSTIMKTKDRTPE
ncbi:hypothetical protein QUC31_000872 [Theobroma cacao]